MEPASARERVAPTMRSDTWSRATAWCCSDESDGVERERTSARIGHAPPSINTRLRTLWPMTPTPLCCRSVALRSVTPKRNGESDVHATIHCCHHLRMGMGTSIRCTASVRVKQSVASFRSIPRCHTMRVALHGLWKQHIRHLSLSPYHREKCLETFAWLRHNTQNHARPVTRSAAETLPVPVH